MERLLVASATIDGRGSYGSGGGGRGRAARVSGAGSWWPRPRSMAAAAAGWEGGRGRRAWAGARGPCRPRRGRAPLHAAAARRRRHIPPSQPSAARPPAHKSQRAGVLQQRLERRRPPPPPRARPAPGQARRQPIRPLHGRRPPPAHRSQRVGVLQQRLEGGDQLLVEAPEELQQRAHDVRRDERLGGTEVVAARGQRARRGGAAAAERAARVRGAARQRRRRERARCARHAGDSPARTAATLSATVRSMTPPAARSRRDGPALGPFRPGSPANQHTGRGVWVWECGDRSEGSTGVVEAGCCGGEGPRPGADQGPGAGRAPCGGPAPGGTHKLRPLHMCLSRRPARILRSGPLPPARAPSLGPLSRRSQCQGAAAVSLAPRAARSRACGVRPPAQRLASRARRGCAPQGRPGGSPPRPRWSRS
jgi:hypothetical protein